MRKLRILTSVVYRLPFIRLVLSSAQTNTSSGLKKLSHVNMKRFGLLAVNLAEAELPRELKPNAEFYAEVCRGNRVT